jgi:two-component system, NtrC family, nitrogen regulation response regulator NtrX
MVLEEPGHTVIDVGTAEDAIDLLQKDDIDILLLDVCLPKMSGIGLLKNIKQTPSLVSLPVIMISGHAAIADAVQAVQLGATDFFEKPLDRDRVLISVTNALKSVEMRRELSRLRAEVMERQEMTGQSRVMKELYAAIEKVASSKSRVLITGESGSGKELVARAIHHMSPRTNAPFIQLNCAAIPSELIESELFGYERGAFTGAQTRKKGLFELADTGTLFLDEIGDMSASAQAKVLRALQSGTISRVGSEKTIAVDTRVLAATNKDLEAEVAKGTFREDLYYRLNVVRIHSPALRERIDDIPLLFHVFMRECSRENGIKEKPTDPEVIEALKRLSWPGNVRELKNAVERMLILSGDRITIDDLQSIGGIDLVSEHGDEIYEEQASDNAAPPSYNGRDMLTLREFREQAERTYIQEVLETCQWNVSKASGILGLERTNLHKKLRALNIRRT